jgi:hypothetical protein
MAGIDESLSLEGFKEAAPIILTLPSLAKPIKMDQPRIPLALDH